ncbi:MAG: STAS domain-containing protein [Actinomycetota bacterium]
MATELAEAHVRRKGGAAVIDLKGDINGSADEVLKRAYGAAAALEATTVVLNFADVNYINSTGIALIVGLLAEARKEHRAVKAVGLTEHYRHIFEITRLADFMPMFATEDDAVA